VYPERKIRETEKNLVLPTLFMKFKLDEIVYSCLFVYLINGSGLDVAEESTRFQAVEFQHFVKRGAKTKYAPLNESAKDTSA
jgi:hypothetical protein